MRDLPHSKQHAFNREVINPHDGHILCVPYLAICGFSLRILRSSRIVNRTISRPKEILVAFIETTLLDEFRIERSNDRPAVKLRQIVGCPLDRLGGFGHHQHCQYRGGIANVSRNRCECF